MRLPGLDTLARNGAAGRDWYSRESVKLARFAYRYGFELATVADVVAITSPRVSVKRNGTLARMYLDTRDPDALPCLPGVKASLRHWEATGEIRGPKTGAFARALRGEPGAVVLDVWVARALGVPQARLTGKRYDREARRIRKGAARLGWAPVEYQAAVWTGVRAAYSYTRPAAGIDMGE